MTATIERYVADMNYVREKVKNTPSDVLVSRKLCECQSRNYGIPDTCDIKEWIIKPMRRKSKAKTDNVLGIKHRDLVSYTYKSGETHTGYVTALYPEQLALNFQSKTKHCKKVNARKCRLLWKFNKIYWLEQCV